MPVSRHLPQCGLVSRRIGVKLFLAMPPPVGRGGASAGSLDAALGPAHYAATAYGTSEGALEVDEDHLNLYGVFGHQVCPLRAVLARDTPESFRYSLQESTLLTYRVEDERHGRGYCTLLPWGYIFTDDHQPAEQVYRIYRVSEELSFTSALTFVHRNCVCFFPHHAQYVIHENTADLLTSWACDQSNRILTPPLHSIEDELNDFDLDGE